MSRHDVRLEIDRLVDEGRELPAPLAARSREEPALRRYEHALRRVDRGLRSAAARLREAPGPALERRVLAALPPRSSPRRARLPLALAAAACLLLASWLALRAPPASAPPPSPRLADARLALPELLRWRSPEGPLPVVPEAALRAEASRLAQDTRRVARSLWSRLPLTGEFLLAPH